ncbi:hypothetical protein ACFE04_006363 [Oxalis oulophora]
MRKPDNFSVVNSTNINNKLNNNNNKLRKGLWSPEEDEKLMKYMVHNGQGCWSDVARNAGLWSQIAARLPGRTDNEIKNFWNSTIKKRLKIISLSSSPNESDNTSSISDLNKELTYGGGGGVFMCKQQQQQQQQQQHSMMFNQMNLQPLINPHDHDHHGLVNVFSNNNNMGFCFGTVDDHEDHPFGGGGIDMYVPPLERSLSMDHKNPSKIMDINNINNNLEKIKAENNIIIDQTSDHGNYWHGEDWDFEDLMKDVVPTFPSFDFQAVE